MGDSVRAALLFFFNKPVLLLICSVSRHDRQDANGRIYYVNHIQRTTQWQRPTLSQANGSNVSTRQSELENFGRRVHISLDSNDEQLTDEPDTLASTPNDGPSRSDNDPSTATSLNKTTPANLPQVSSASNDDDQPSSSSNQTEPPTEPQAAAAAAAAAAAPNSRAPPNQGTDLPPNWSLQIAPNGRTFYIDHNKKTTTWNHPVTGKSSPVPPKGAAPNRIRSSSISSNNNSASTTLMGRLFFLGHKFGDFEFNSFFRAAVDDAGPLPAGWEERVHSDGRIFFIDHNTRSTSWEVSSN